MQDHDVHQHTAAASSDQPSRPGGANAEPEASAEAAPDGGNLHQSRPMPPASVSSGDDPSAGSPSTPPAQKSLGPAKQQLKQVSGVSNLQARQGRPGQMLSVELFPEERQSRRRLAKPKRPCVQTCSNKTPGIGICRSKASHLLTLDPSSPGHFLVSRWCPRKIQ